MRIEQKNKFVEQKNWSKIVILKRIKKSNNIYKETIDILQIIF